MPPLPAPGPVGVVAGTVTINGEARPIVWVELQQLGGFPWAYGTTIPSGSWEWGRIPAGDYVLVIKTPPGLTCDATRKSATVRADQRTVVNFACFGDVKGSIQGFAAAEFGTVASARITLTGPVNRETISNRDGFFAFEDLPPGEYLIGWCKDPVTASVRYDKPPRGVFPRRPTRSDASSTGRRSDNRVVVRAQRSLVTVTRVLRPILSSKGL